ncbi:MAG: stage II sporulation protein P [Clostridia bacterium]|nr:stage II sporulation protein P [Clostridia bacterium]
MKREGRITDLLTLAAGFAFCLILALVSRLPPGFFSFFKKDGAMTPFVKNTDGLPGGGFTETFIPAPRPRTRALPEVFIRNDTDFDADKNALLARGVRVKKADGVSVIIVHTHGTEAYTRTESEKYEESDSFRTTDGSKNVTRVGEELARALEARGIACAHYTEYCDYPAYSGAYDRSRELIERALAAHPEATVVIDLHRDAILSADGSYLRTAANINGRDAAQIEFVCGTDAGGLSHPAWRDNLSFQLYLQQRLQSEYPGLMRPVNLRRARFNQHFRTGSMLIEIGACGNTLSEALYSARLFGDLLGRVLSE